MSLRRAVFVLRVCAAIFAPLTVGWPTSRKEFVWNTKDSGRYDNTGSLSHRNLLYPSRTKYEVLSGNRNHYDERGGNIKSMATPANERMQRDVLSPTFIVQSTTPRFAWSHPTRRTEEPKQGVGHERGSNSLNMSAVNKLHVNSRTRPSASPLAPRSHFTTGTRRHERKPRATGNKTYDYGDYYSFNYQDYIDQRELATEATLLEKFSKKYKKYSVALIVGVNVLLCVLCCCCLVAKSMCVLACQGISNFFCLYVDKCLGRDPSYRQMMPWFKKLGIPRPTYDQYMDMQKAMGININI